MIIFPAIDISKGRVVRLAEGDYDRMTVYGDDPAGTADEFCRMGAEYLHVVDLDAAKDGGQPNFSVVQSLSKRVGFLQIGGGGRDERAVERYLEAGAARVVIGSAAIEKPGFLAEMAKKYPGKIAAGVDARDGVIMIRGWRVSTGVDAFEFMRALPGIDVNTAIFTDISRDGMMRGANIQAYKKSLEIEGLHTVASGGVSSEEDIRRLTEMKLYGAIIGRALYNGALSLKKALSIAEGLI